MTSEERRGLIRLIDQRRREQLGSTRQDWDETTGHGWGPPQAHLPLAERRDHSLGRSLKRIAA